MKEVEMYSGMHLMGMPGKVILNILVILINFNQNVSHRFLVLQKWPEMTQNDHFYPSFVFSCNILLLLLKLITISSDDNRHTWNKISIKNQRTLLTVPKYGQKWLNI